MSDFLNEVDVVKNIGLNRMFVLIRSSADLEDELFLPKQDFLLNTKKVMPIRIEFNTLNSGESRVEQMDEQEDIWFLANVKIKGYN